MKVLAVNGSPRKKGNTSILLETVLGKIRPNGFKCEVLCLADFKINGCIACGGCKKEKGDLPRCVQEDKDDFKGMIEKFIGADAIILGTPVYFGSATPEIMALLHRVGYAIRSKKKPVLKNKVGAAVVVARRAGQNFTLAQINYWFQINEMIIPGSSYWNIGFGRGIGDVKNDKEGLETMERLGENIVALLGKLRG
jgi:multimeric flavodoxin WrbA